MNLSHVIFTSLVMAQVYYLYKFINSIPLKYKMGSLRGFNDNFHEMHTQTHLPPLHLDQTKSDNNTALTYMHVTTLDAVDRF